MSKKEDDTGCLITIGLFSGIGLLCEILEFAEHYTGWFIFIVVCIAVIGLVIYAAIKGLKEEAERKRKAAEAEAERKRKAAEAEAERKRKAAAEEVNRKYRAEREEAERKRKAAAVEEAMKRKAAEEEEARKRKAAEEEEARKRKAAEEEAERKWEEIERKRKEEREETERKRKEAEEEAKRKAIQVQVAKAKAKVEARMRIKQDRAKMVDQLGELIKRLPADKIVVDTNVLMDVLDFDKWESDVANRWVAYVEIITRSSPSESALNVLSHVHYDIRELKANLLIFAIQKVNHKICVLISQLNELANIKRKGDDDRKYKVREAVKLIEDLQKKDLLEVVGDVDAKESYADREIIRTCRMSAKEGHQPCVITEDRDLRIRLRAAQIPCKSLDDLIDDSNQLQAEGETVGG